MPTAPQYPKRLIEVDLPIKRISAHARREKSIRHGHISTLHIWWARRPLASCRAVICASLWLDPADILCPSSFRDTARGMMLDWAGKQRHLMGPESLSRFMAISHDPSRLEDNTELRVALLDFIADFANWDNSTKPEYLTTARALTQAAHEALGGALGTRPLVVDPFAGGGAIPLEALRVGADAFASDLNPVAVLLNKVVLEYIPKYGQRLAEEVRKWGEWVREQAEKELAEFYPKDADGATPIAYIWARTIKCEGPGCGAEVALMRSLWLAKKGKHSVALQMVPDGVQRQVDFEVIQNANPHDIGEGTVRKGSATCRVCGYTTPVSAVREQLKHHHGGAADARLVAVVTTIPGQQGRAYRLPTKDDILATQKAALQFHIQKEMPHEGLSRIPNESTEHYHSFVNRGPIYGMLTWEDYFTPRQALVLSTLVQLVRKAGLLIAAQTEDGLATAVETCLSFALDKQVDSNSSLCSWRSTSQDIGHTFGRQALPMLWDFVEANVISGSTRDWKNAVEGTLKALESLDSGIKAGQAEHASAIAIPLPDDVAQAFVTDPPYYYSVQYADLSDFFYVWLRRLLSDRYPDLFSTPLTPKEEEIIVQSPGHQFAPDGKNNAFYESRMCMAMAQGRRVLEPSGIGMVVFAHTSTAGWEAQLQAMLDAGWIITGSWPIDTEMATRVIAQGRSVLASSIHLVCRPRENADGSLHNDEVGDWRDVLAELPRRIHDWMPRLAEEDVVGADAIFACLGPALEIFSRYSRVEKASGEQVTLKEYLEHVWAAVSREALNMIFKDADATGFEEDARLTAIWFWVLKAARDENGKEPVSTGPSEDESEDDNEAEPVPRGKRAGYTLEYDAARKLAQGLGVTLDKLNRPGGIISIQGNLATLNGVASREAILIGVQLSFEGEGMVVQSGGAVGQSKEPRVQMRHVQGRMESLFDQLPQEQPDNLQRPLPGFSSQEHNEPLMDRLLRSGVTLLDRLHQAMLLFSRGQSALVARFLHETNVGVNPRFWTLAQALSALYPPSSDEKRWVDGVLARKKGLGY